MRISGGLKTTLFVLALALALFQIGTLVISVAQQVDRLSKASSGDGLWHLSQVEVDYRRLTTALAEADDPAGYGEVRHRFDVLFSRVLTLQEGDSYAIHRTQPTFSNHLSEVLAYLNAALPYIDGDDVVMARELEKLISKTKSIDDPIRHLALNGVLNNAQLGEALRNDTRDLLLRLFAATMALIVGLILLIIVLRRLYKRAQTISDDNRMARARIASMIHASLDAILVTDPDGKLLDMNRAAERLFDIDLKSADDIYLSALIRGRNEDGSYNNPAKSGLLAKGRVETKATRKNGATFPVEISLVQAETEERSDIYVAYVRDISARLEAEESLKQARDDAQAGEKAKARLLAVMSHEIRTPLNGVLGAADLLSKTELDAGQERYVTAMQTSGEILQRHINDVLELSRLDEARLPRQLTPIDLHQLIPEIVESQRPFAEQAETRLDLRVFKNVPDSVLGDQLALQQVLLNLVGNAIKFTTGGSVCVEVDHFGQGDIIEFRIIDDGIGITEEEVSKVFEDFYASDTSFARRKQGTGLGLGITKRIVTSMGGDIGAESIPNEGSLFWFRLPMRPVNAVVLPKGMHDRNLVSAHPSDILLVEDNEINRMIASDMLQNAGHRVTLATGGKHGVDTAKEKAFDLILMDISMPDMDGLTAAELIRRSNGASKDTPIIALTAQSLSFANDQIDPEIISQVLQKPLTSQALNLALESALSDSEGADWGGIAPIEDHVLNEEILNDVVANIGEEKTQAHFEELQQDMQMFLKQLKNEDDEDLPSAAHRLAGAAAVLGLCALHRHLAQLEFGSSAESGTGKTEREWQIAQQSFQNHFLTKSTGTT